MIINDLISFVREKEGYSIHSYFNQFVISYMCASRYIYL